MKNYNETEIKNNITRYFIKGIAPDDMLLAQLLIQNYNSSIITRDFAHAETFQKYFFKNTKQSPLNCIEKSYQISLMIKDLHLEDFDINTICYWINQCNPKWHKVNDSNEYDLFDGFTIFNRKEVYGQISDEILPYLCPEKIDEIAFFEKYEDMVSYYTVYKYYHCDYGVIYIGKSNSSLKSRINSHKREEKFHPYLSECKIFYLELNSRAETAVAEMYLINEYKPILNSTGKEIGELNFDCNLPDNWKEYVL